VAPHATYCADMADSPVLSLPLFPLGTVLFPGAVLPLHVFEERYRVLVRDLVALPEPARRFGVVAIREGRDVGADGVRSLHGHGCFAQLRRVEPYADGRYDIVTVGAGRFRLDAVDGDSAPYLRGAVTPLPDYLGDADTVGQLVMEVRAAFLGYLRAMASVQGLSVPMPELPDEPLLLSYLVAATAVPDLTEAQHLLGADDTTRRLQSELALLRREASLLRTLTAAPAPDLARGPVNLN